MLTVRVKKFIQKIGRNLDFKEKQPVTFDKSKVECYNCHRKGHFAKECRSGRNQGKRTYADNGRRNAPTNESSSQALVAQDDLGGYDWSNDFEIEPVNYALMAISSSSSSSSSDSEVQNCSKCFESFNTLQKNFDSERAKHNKAKLGIQGYELALGSLESRILGHKNQMSATDKTRLGYGIQLDELGNRSKTNSEMSMSVFEVKSSDEETSPASDKFSKADVYHVVLPPITGNFLTPRADISFTGLDKYAFRKKISESKTAESKTITSDSKTSETIGKTNELVVSKLVINRDKVIIEDWNSDDEDDVSPVKTVNFVKPNETQKVWTQRSYYTQPALRPKDLKQDIKTFGTKNMTTAGTSAVVNIGKGKLEHASKKSRWGNPKILLHDLAAVDSGYSSHMTGNKAYLLDYEDYNGGFVAFGSDPKGGKITGKGRIRTANLDFDNVYFVDELKFNLFSVSQMCDKKNSVLFTDTECLILSPSFKLLDESQ
ncbi:ribonuclease H-like domain-containing protein, partial [Tanacetum coccineum]